MTAMVRAFQEGGPTMYLVLGLAVLGHVTAIVAVAMVLSQPTRARKRIGGAVALALAVATLAAGYFGWRHGLELTDEAVVGASPDMRAALHAQGEEEARHNLTFGLYACVLPLLAGAALLGLSTRDDDAG
jgi:hypothetical protein